MTDLYEAIGASPGDSPEEIKRAYRKAALASHPDAGGSVEEFKLVGFAGLILCDQEKRAHYDRTGEHRGPENAVEHRIASLLERAFLQDKMDPVRFMCATIDEERSKVNADIARLGQTAKRLAARLEKFEQANAKSANTTAREFIICCLKKSIEDHRRIAELAKAESELLTESLAFLNGLSSSAQTTGGWQRGRGGSGFSGLWERE